MNEKGCDRVLVFSQKTIVFCLCSKQAEVCREKALRLLSRRCKTLTHSHCESRWTPRWCVHLNCCAHQAGGHREARSDGHTHGAIASAQTHAPIVPSLPSQNTSSKIKLLRISRQWQPGIKSSMGALQREGPSGGVVFRDQTPASARVAWLEADRASPSVPSPQGPSCFGD